MLFPCRDFASGNTVVDFSSGDIQQVGDLRHGDSYAVSLIGTRDVVFIKDLLDSGICECFSFRGSQAVLI